jgi:hypothetical protein
MESGWAGLGSRSMGVRRGIELVAALDAEEHGRGMDDGQHQPGERQRFQHARQGQLEPKPSSNLALRPAHSSDLLFRAVAAGAYEGGAVPSEPLFVARPSPARHGRTMVCRPPTRCCSTGRRSRRAGGSQGQVPVWLAHGCWIPRA